MSEGQRQPAVPLAEGEILAGKYRVERVLGRGGMGVVVAATHLALRQQVAVKFLLRDAEPEVVQRFLREARAAARLRSEHVARVLDVAELPSGAPYMVMEYLEGTDLSRLSRKKGQLPVEDAVDYVLQACEAIGEAHAAGIVHRDLKPANLFLTTAANGTATVKVLDFGVSKDKGRAEGQEAGDEEMDLTSTTAVLGSPFYMAPEQMRSSRDVDARADIWSLGIILYQLLTRTVPFKAEGFFALGLMVMNDPPPPPTKHRPDLPPALEAAILRCLAKDPADRFASVTELATAIAPFGRSSVMGPAERIARAQGAAVPAADKPTSASLPPPAAMGTSGSLGPELSSGPSIPAAPASTAVPTPSRPGPRAYVATAAAALLFGGLVAVIWSPRTPAAANGAAPAPTPTIAVGPALDPPRSAEAPDAGEAHPPAPPPRAEAAAPSAAAPPGAPPRATGRAPSTGRVPLATENPFR